MIDIQHCWACGERLQTFSEEMPFHCSERCQKECKYWNYIPAAEKEDLKDENR